METIKLAVYGTLKTGHNNHDILGPDAVTLAHGIRIPNLALYEIGWFPGAIRDNEGSGVECEIVEVPVDRIRYVDGYEGYDPEQENSLSLFTREHIKLPNGDDAIIYLFNRDVRNGTDFYQLIPSGKWEN